MDNFVRGARVRRPEPLDRQLTLIEASFVMCSVAERHGITDAEEFLKYMSRALETYKRAAEGKP